MPKFANLQTLEKLLTLVKGYVDKSVHKKMDSFLPGEGLSLENGILTVTLDTDLFKVVDFLPATPAASDANKIFLVFDRDGTYPDNVYIEYLYTDHGWEEIGKRQVGIDMEQYLKRSELTATVDNSSFSIQKGFERVGTISFDPSDFRIGQGGDILEISLPDTLYMGGVPSGMYKLTIDKKGRVTDYLEVQLSDLTALGVASQVDLDVINSNLENESRLRETENANLHQIINDVTYRLETEAQERIMGDNQAVESTAALVEAEKSDREMVDMELRQRIESLENDLAGRPILTREDVINIFNELYS